MSKWRLEGFVQDSDDEEVDLESSQSYANNYSHSALSARIDDAFSKATNTRGNGEGRAPHTNLEGTAGGENNAAASRITPDRWPAPLCFSTSSMIPHVDTDPSRPLATASFDVAVGSLRKLSESPDPIQSSLSPRRNRSRTIFTSSQSLGVDSDLQIAPTSRAEVLDDELFRHRNIKDGSARDQDLIEWGLSPLPDASQSDFLSDPPSDLDLDSPTRTVFASPKSRAIVQVVIPQAVAAQRSVLEQGIKRSFRERQLIQLHPYLVEGERYKRELQGRGIKPVLTRARSPGRIVALDDVETQERDFDPDDDRPSSSPPDILFSIPAPEQSMNSVHKRLDQRPQSSYRPPRLEPTAPITSSSDKRRKLNEPSTQKVHPARKTVYQQNRHSSNIWDLPQSPPHSSSPRSGGVNTAQLAESSPTKPLETDTLTPLHTSSLEGDAQREVESDPEPIARSIYRSAELRQRPIFTIPSDSSSSDTESDRGESVPREDIKKVGKRIKGVLPASWLRLDQMVQERRKAHARERPDAAPSPEQTEQQRGVAQKVTRRRGSLVSTPQPSDQSHDIVVISEESDNETDDIFFRATEVRQSVKAASDLAAIIDRQYAEGLDSDDMENDRLDLDRLGHSSRKRKKQTKLNNVFTKRKRTKMSSGTAKLSTILYPRTQNQSKKARSRRANRSPPQALSVLDFDQSHSKRKQDVPQFLKLAQRQARRRSDHARQSPTSKYIRLHTLLDTEDANAALHEWRSGALKPKEHVGKPHQNSEERRPLIDIDMNQMLSQQLRESNENTTTNPQQCSKSLHNSRQLIRNRALHPSLMVFQRGADSLNDSYPYRATTFQARKLPRESGFRRKYRAAQLEGSETGYGQVDRKFAFADGLRQVDRRFELQSSQAQPSRNPQLARFLADDDAVLQPLLLAEPVGEQTEPSPTTKPLKPKRRLMRKSQAQRVDVDLREYRQPSEPVLHDILEDVAVNKLDQDQEQYQPKLQGLDSYGARYSTTFDVSPLKSDTYFHTSTFIGGLELRRALQCGQRNARDVDKPAGYYVIRHRTRLVRCGPWNDETFSAIDDLMNVIWLPLDGQTGEEDLVRQQQNALRDSANLLRSLSSYVSTNLSFLDPIDRQAFAINMKQWTESLFSQTFGIAIRGLGEHTKTVAQLDLIRTMTYLLVLTMQIRQIAQHAAVDTSVALELANLAKKNSKLIVTFLLRQVSALSDFLERNNQFKERENGIQNSDILVESVVVCMHVLTSANQPRSTFWDLVSQELSTQTGKATHVKHFDTLWGTLFTLLPFVEIDDSGLLARHRRLQFKDDNWTLVRDLLKRLFSLYPQTARAQSSAVNDYVRATLSRCHVLVDCWHWVRCEPMLSAVFDFFAKNGLQQLRREPGNGSARFLEDLAGKQILRLETNDHSFQIFLKCLALGLRGMRGGQGECVKRDIVGEVSEHKAYSEKKLRSTVFRLTPNHGRSHPKDQHLDAESLDALRNHHDLLCTLYWQSPPACRPRLELIRGLVNHGNAHREACRLNVRAWANLTAFQTSTGEPYNCVRPFAEWYKEMTAETLKQYRLAKTEAEDYLQSGALENSDTTSLMVRQTMEKNQEQPIATLRDCILGMQKAVVAGTNQYLLQEFLMDSGLVQLLELPHFEDTRLVAVIRDTLKVLRTYATLTRRSSACEDTHQASEESQDYGDSFDLDDFNAIELQSLEAPSKQKPLDFVQVSLWHLLSNAFGAEKAPDDNLLMECIDTWALVAGRQVSLGARHWSEFIDSLGSVSWQQLRRTEQTQKFGPYFSASLLNSDSAIYGDHRFEFLGALLLSLADREATLRFQHHLLYALTKVAPNDPLLINLPFYQVDQNAEFDINADTFRARRLQLISSILANMRNHIQQTISKEPELVAELRGNYSLMLKNFMAAMKNNYQQLGQGTTVTGAYIEFVQKVVQFLQQYTADICPVLDFFTNSTAFPLPATDPTYVVGRLCGYAPKIANVGIPKQLSVFIQTVAQQAAASNQQVYLVHQLETALCTDEAPSKDKTALRSVLMQGVFPAYIETAFDSLEGLIIARPILQSLSSILRALLFDVRVFDEENIRWHYDTILALAHAFIRSSKQLKGNAALLQKPHALKATALLLDALMPAIDLLDYIYGRCFSCATKPGVIIYLEQLNVFIAEVLYGRIPQEIPSYDNDPHTGQGPHSNLLSFSREGLKTSIKANWSTQGDRIFFGQGHTKREVVVDFGSVEEEQTRLVSSIERFYTAISHVYGDRDGGRSERRGFLGNINV